MNAPGTATALGALATGALLQLDRLEYDTGWNLQRRLVEDRRAGLCYDTLLLLEHDPVFTVGRTGRPAHWGGDESASDIAGVPLRRVERGGSVTYHGPGQLVGYPILRIASFCDGPKAYMRMLEEVLIRTLARWEIASLRLDRLPGVWVAGERPAKIGAVGARIERGVTMHGFALNVTVDLRPFSWIAPCGLAGCRVTSMGELLAGQVEPAEVRRRLVEQFAEVFGLKWTEFPR